MYSRRYTGFDRKFRRSSIVIRTVAGIDAEPTYVGNPPTLTPNRYEAVRILGRLLNYDESMSPFNNEACAFCHMPYTGFSGPIPSVNLTMVAYPRFVSLPGRQADSAAIHLFTEISRASLEGGKELWDPWRNVHR